MWKQVAYPILGSKVFTDARWLVTPKEGDRYPLEPPTYNISLQLGIYNAQ